MNTEITQTLNNMGLTMTAEFVPFSQSRNAKKNPQVNDLSINWSITINRGNRSLTTDYMQGIGHLPEEIKQKSFNRITIAEYETIQFACETSKIGFFSDVSKKIIIKPNNKKLNPPTLEDVLYCLLLDSEVLNYDSFESWANEFGYNVDSIKDQKVYNECMKIALKFKSMFTDIEITKLHELYQDY